MTAKSDFLYEYEPDERDRAAAHLSDRDVRRELRAEDRRATHNAALLKCEISTDIRSCINVLENVCDVLDARYRAGHTHDAEASDEMHERLEKIQQRLEKFIGWFEREAPEGEGVPF